MLAGVAFAKERGQALVELDHDIVQSPTFAIHADFDAMAREHARAGITQQRLLPLRYP